MSKEIENFTYAPQGYEEPGHHERGTHRLIEDYKTYRIQPKGGRAILLKITDQNSNTITFIDLSTKEKIVMRRSDFQEKLDNGEIYVSSKLVAALQEVVK